MKRDDPETRFDESKLEENELLTLCSYTVLLERAQDLAATDLFGGADPYCVVSIQGLERKSKTVYKNLNPSWNETFRFFTENPQALDFALWDEDQFGRGDPMGQASFDTKELFERSEAGTKEGAVFQGELKLEKVKKGKLVFKLICRRLTPVKTERLLALAEEQLEQAEHRVQEKTFELKQAMEKAQADHEEFKAALVARDGTIADLEATKTRLVKEAQEKIERRAQDIARLEATQKSLISQIDKLKEDSQRQAEESKESVMRLEQTLKESAKTIQDSKTHVQRLENEIAQMSQSHEFEVKKPFCVMCGATCLIQ